MKTVLTSPTTTGNTSPTTLFARRRSSGGSSTLSRLDLSQTPSVDGTEDWREETITDAYLDQLFEANTSGDHSESPLDCSINATAPTTTTTTHPHHHLLATLTLTCSTPYTLSAAIAATSSPSLSAPPTAAPLMLKRPSIKRCSLSSLNLSTAAAWRKPTRTRRHFSSAAAVALPLSLAVADRSLFS